nr:hypothetical protein [uncultured Pseudomonas sp.]
MANWFLTSELKLVQKFSRRGSGPPFFGAFEGRNQAPAAPFPINGPGILALRLPLASLPSDEGLRQGSALPSVTFSIGEQFAGRMAAFGFMGYRPGRQPQSTGKPIHDQPA